MLKSRSTKGGARGAARGQKLAAELTKRSAALAKVADVKSAWVIVPKKGCVKGSLSRKNQGHREAKAKSELGLLVAWQCSAERSCAEEVKSRKEDSHDNGGNRERKGGASACPLSKMTFLTKATAEKVPKEVDNPKREEEITQEPSKKLHTLLICNFLKDQAKRAREKRTGNENREKKAFYQRRAD